MEESEPGAKKSAKKNLEVANAIKLNDIFEEFFY